MKYIAEIALNKEGIVTREEFEIKLPATLAEVDAQERDMFNHLCFLWDKYRLSGFCEPDVVHLACNFYDWVHDNIRFKKNTICWTTNRSKSDAHITIIRE